MNLEIGPLKLTTNGELLGSGADASLKLMPGRKVVSIAKANKRAEELFTECINDIVREAKANNWSDGFLLWRVQSAAEDFGKRMNLEEIVGRATKLLEEDKELDEQTMDSIDSEWVAALVEHSERTSDEDMRDIIAAILAGEINQPGSYSKSAITTLSRMDANQVKMFESVCRYIVYPCYSQETGLSPIGYDPMLVLNPDDGGKSYANGSLRYTTVMEMEALGLVSKNSQRSIDIKAGVAIPLMVGDDYAFLACREGEKNITFGVVLTRTGVELSRLFEARDNDSLHDQLNQKADNESLYITWTACSGIRKGKLYSI